MLISSSLLDTLSWWDRVLTSDAGEGPKTSDMTAWRIEHPFASANNDLHYLTASSMQQNAFCQPGKSEMGAPAVVAHPFEHLPASINLRQPTNVAHRRGNISL